MTFPAPHRIERIELRAGRAILINNVGKLTAGEEVECNDLQMRLIIRVQPKVDGLRREAAVGEGDDEGRPGPENACDFGEGFHRASEILHGDGAQGGIERIILKGQGLVRV